MVAKRSEKFSSINKVSQQTSRLVNKLNSSVSKALFGHQTLCSVNKRIVLSLNASFGE